MSISTHRSAYSRDLYRKAATELGLAVSPGPDEVLTVMGRVELYGALDGVALSYWREEDTAAFRSKADPPVWRTRSFVRFPVPLDLGLSVRSIPLDRDGPEPGSITTGDVRFDTKFTVRCDEPERALALLDAEVRASLLALEGLRDVDLDDHGLNLSRRAQDTEVQEIVDHVHALVRWGKASRAALARVPIARELRPIAGELRETATRLGLGFSSAPLVAWGAMPGVTVELHSVRREGGGVALRVAASLDGLNAPVTVTPRTAMHALKDVFSSRDFLTGDEDFDTALHASSDDAAAARAALRPRVTAALHALYVRTGLGSLENKVFNADKAHLDPARGVAALEGLSALGRALVGLDEAGGPYR
jgi:hypothetical protein